MIDGNLEYLMSSLPHLSFQNNEETRTWVSSILRKYADPSAPEVNLIDVLDKEAEKFLSPKASHLLRRIDLTTVHDIAFQQSSNRVLSAFSTYAFALKEAVRRLRISRRNGKNEPSQKDEPLPLIPGTPLEEEIQLMKFQWDKLEELSDGHFADFGSLIAYKLKLMILLRWWSLEEDRGIKTFTQITNQEGTWPKRS